MSRPSTSRDVQRVTFIESLYGSLKKQAKEALSEQKKLISLASAYLEDGLEDKECIELLVIDGLSRETAESYVMMAQASKEEICDEMPEYTFQFEDSSGMVLSSYDIGRTISASNDDEAWTKAEEILFENSDTGEQKLISVNRVN